jgi:hypothetical protein
MEDRERRLRQLLARHIQFRAEGAAHDPLDAGACYQAVALVRLWQAAGDEWDQPDAFAHFDHLMADHDLGRGVIDVSEEELRTVAQAVAEAARSCREAPALPRRGMSNFATDGSRGRNRLGRRHSHVQDLEGSMLAARGPAPAEH